MEHLASHHCSLQSSQHKKCVMFSVKAGGEGVHSGSPSALSDCMNT